LTRQNVLGQLLLFVILGFVVGAIGRLTVVGGENERVAPWIENGVVGAVLGGLGGHVAGARAPDAGTGALLAAFVGAIVLSVLAWSQRRQNA
jgi:uncharacterized membrane protein YeaQ/YmgE (transglycosylase-associated protein family)